MYSMTGYAADSVLLTEKNNSTVVSINVKSLNSKFFEATCKISSFLQSHETEIYKILKNRLVRGTVYCSISINNQNFFQETITPALCSVKAYYEALQTIKNELNLASPVTLDHIVRMPNIFVFQENNISKEHSKLIYDALDRCLFELMNTRRVEGSILEQDILHRFILITHELEKIKPLFLERIAHQKKLVHEGLQEIQADVSLLATAQKNALYTLLDKLDLQEEITRFTGHIVTIKDVMASKQIEKGKRLDFLLQESMREVNTILAKCNDLQISTHALNIKVELEKIREQIQNIL